MIAPGKGGGHQLFSSVQYVIKYHTEGWALGAGCLVLGAGRWAPCAAAAAAAAARRCRWCSSVLSWALLGLFWALLDSPGGIMGSHGTSWCSSGLSWAFMVLYGLSWALLVLF